MLLNVESKLQTESGIRAVLFDFDGTLLDSFSVHYAAYEAMFARFEISISREAFLRSYSPNWYKTYEAFGLGREHWEMANSIWLEEADKHRPDLFPGVREVLETLNPEFKLGIVTSGSRIRVARDIRRIGIESFFETLITGDDISEPKPSPESLERALTELSLPPEQALYIGDAHADFEMARAAQVRFIGVRSEFANLESEHPEYEILPITTLPASLGLRRK